MREFMDHITRSFFRATGWDRDNSYSELNATANELLNFALPHGVRLALSSLATPHFSTSYQLGAFGNVDGSIAYLYTSVPLHGVVAGSDRIPLLPLLRSYRHLNDLGLATQQPSSAISQTLPNWLGGTATAHANIQDSPITQKATLLYGCMFLPRSTLQARIIQRLTPALQVQLSAVSSEDLRNGGTILGSAHYDRGIYNVEGLASTDGGLLGLRGLYNFGGDASPAGARAVEETSNGHGSERERIYGRFSVGGELYYGTLNKSAGMSVGARFATLPTYSGTPLTATVTINPLMGNISATYAVLGGDHCTLATMMDFNVYSYESNWQVGMELWSKRRRPGAFLLGTQSGPGSGPALTAEEDQPKRKERSFQAKLEWRLDNPEPIHEGEGTTGALGDKDIGEHLGVLKARLDQQGRIGLLWEGRIKALIFGLGAGIDLQRLDQSFQSVGLNIQYSS